ncbi:MAG: hypothetical protein MUC47_10215, partial [Candidatus Kapabacteria bacterium]|nr:hypothetical protein [Candidatus Kapabacteria bacterium]
LICTLSSNILARIHDSFSRIRISESTVAEFEVHKLAAYGRLRDIQSCLSSSQDAERRLRRGSSNWITYKEHVILVYLSLKQFNAAVQAYLDLEALGTSSLQPFRKQRLILYRSFLRYAIDHSEETLDGIDQKIRPVVPNLLPSQCSELTAFKQGLNASILVLRILVLFQQGALDEAILLEDSLRAYLRRNIAKAENAKRTRLFLTFLFDLIRGSMEATRIMRLTDRLREQLDMLSNDYDEAEILPYDFVLSCLINDIHTHRKKLAMS